MEPNTTPFTWAPRLRLFHRNLQLIKSNLELITPNISALSLQHSSSQWRPSFQSPMPGSSCSQLRPLSLLHPISYKSPSHHYLTSLEFFHFPLSLLLYLGQTLSSHPDHNYSFLISSLPLHLSFQFISYTASLVSFLNYRFQQSILSSKFYCSSPKSSLLNQSSEA